MHEKKDKVLNYGIPGARGDKKRLSVERRDTRCTEKNYKVWSAGIPDARSKSQKNDKVSRATGYQMHGAKVRKVTKCRERGDTRCLEFEMGYQMPEV